MELFRPKDTVLDGPVKDFAFLADSADLSSACLGSNTREAYRRKGVDRWVRNRRGCSRQVIGGGIR